MTIAATIKESLSILNNQTWNYYTSANKMEAKRNMRQFVALTNTLPEELRQTLRNLWEATYIYKRCCCRAGITKTDRSKVQAYDTAKREAMSILNPLIA